jgi:hypothetical protein
MSRVKIHLVPRFRMTGTIPPLPPCMECRGTTSLLPYRFVSTITCLIKLCTKGRINTEQCSWCVTSGFSLRNNARTKQCKVTKAQQARTTHHYKNAEQKLHQTSAAIRFNTKCIFSHFTPKYIHTTVNGKMWPILFKQNLSNAALLIPQHMGAQCGLFYLNKTCQTLHCWYHNIWGRNLAYFI